MDALLRELAPAVSGNKPQSINHTATFVLLQNRTYGKKDGLPRTRGMAACPGMAIQAHAAFSTASAAVT